MSQPRSTLRTLVSGWWGALGIHACVDWIGNSGDFQIFHLGVSLDVALRAELWLGWALRPPPPQPQRLLLRLLSRSQGPTGKNLEEDWRGAGLMLEAQRSLPRAPASWHGCPWCLVAVGFSKMPSGKRREWAGQVVRARREARSPLAPSTALVPSLFLAKTQVSGDSVLLPAATSQEACSRPPW